MARYKMALVIVRLLMIPVLLLGFLVFPRLLFLFVSGGPEAVDGWIWHLATIGASWENMFNPSYVEPRVNRIYRDFATLAAITASLLIVHEFLRRKIRSDRHALSKG